MCVGKRLGSVNAHVARSLWVRFRRGRGRRRRRRRRRAPAPASKVLALDSTGPTPRRVFAGIDSPPPVDTPGDGRRATHSAVAARPARLVARARRVCTHPQILSRSLRRGLVEILSSDICLPLWLTSCFSRRFMLIVTFFVRCPFRVTWIIVTGGWWFQSRRGTRARICVDESEMTLRNRTTANRGRRRARLTTRSRMTCTWMIRTP
ncbi:uncharacterized protein LOC105200384 isoform X2 [Solenopsis invicta]|uniref:uncharacterized protein LOC105200384 isoform X2 n=1 Tax=Solenopsis invicta TaxID=13686 RepID=UPI00193DC5B6|nr:uncharacterized protein LOC105200384 isoform X2 [Solenopsis invicta]